MEDLNAPAVYICGQERWRANEAHFRAEAVEQFDVGARNARMQNVAANRDAPPVYLPALAMGRKSAAKGERVE